MKSLSVHTMPTERNGQAQMPRIVLGGVSILRQTTDH